MPKSNVFMFVWIPEADVFLSYEIHLDGKMISEKFYDSDFENSEIDLQLKRTFANLVSKTMPNNLGSILG